MISPEYTSPPVERDTATLPSLFSAQKGWEERRVYVLTDKPDWEMELQLRSLLYHIPAKEMVVFPDVSPTERGLIPTGALVTIDTEQHPDWRKYIKGADIGCGMAMAPLQISGRDLKNSQAELDELYRRLDERQLIDQLGGNHFVNLAADVETDQVTAVVHTGSRGDRQKKLGALVDNPQKYDGEYEPVVASGIDVREEMIDVVRSLFGEGGPMGDTIHNTIEHNPDGSVTIRKGVTHITYPDQPQILPSSADGLMLIHRPGQMALTLSASSHGTGRAISRRDMRVSGMNDGQNPNIMTPVQMAGKWPLTEQSNGYHSLERSLDILSRYGFVGDEDQHFLQPIAGIKQI
ncbi:MAG: hypothetical protein ACK5NN_13615 [Sphingomonadaceae bacterium]